MRKINRIRNGNKNRLYYIFGMIAICAFVSIGIGYSIMSSTVKIDGTASITSTWRVVFTKAVENTMQGATTTAEPSITGGTTLDIGVELDEKGSQAIYDVTVENQGTIDSYVKEIRLNEGEPTDLKVYVSGLYKGFSLKAGESKTFQVIAEWSAGAPESSETEKDVNVSVDFEQETEDVEQPQLSMPTYTIDYPNEVWTKEKNVTMKYPEGDGILYQYSTDGGRTWLIAPASTYVLKFSQDGTLYIRVSDGVSVLTTPLITIEKIDNKVPEVEIIGNDDTWEEQKTITIQAKDEESGLTTNPYSWDGGSSWTSVKEKEFTSNQTVNIWVKDNAGNINKQTITIDKIDTEKPTNVKLQEGTITSSSISVIASATQNGGGIRGYQFQINNGAWSSEQTSATKTFTGLTKNTSYTIKVRVYANNGKYTDSSIITVKTNDITVPTYSVVDDGPNLTKEVTIQYGGTKTSNLIYEYSTNGGSNWTTVNGNSTTITFTEDGSVIARVRDTGNNNNTVTASTLTIQFPINMLISGLELGELTSIEFVANTAPTGTEYLDVSEEQNGSIQLWTDSTGKSYVGSMKEIYANINSDMLFTTSDTNNLQQIEFNSYLNTSLVESMSMMFEFAENLTELDLSSWDTSNVTNMYSIFHGAWRLKTLNLSGWDTSQVKDMSYMFNNTQNLTSLDIRHFDTSNVTDMSYMFENSHTLTSLDVSQFKMSNVESIGYMFSYMDNLISLDLSSWDTSNVTNMDSVFSGDINLTTLDISDWDTSQVESMYYMFDSMGEGNPVYFHVGSKVKDYSGFVSGSAFESGTRELHLYDDGTKAGYDLVEEMVSEASSESVTHAGVLKDGMTLLNLNRTGWLPSNVEYVQFVTMGPSSTDTTVDLSKDDDGTVLGWQRNTTYFIYRLDKQATVANPNSSWLFGAMSDRNLKRINFLGFFNTVNVTNFSNMFYGRMGLTSIDLNRLDTSNATNYSFMFGQCTALTTLDASTLDFDGVTNTISMFSQATNLTTTLTVKGNTITSYNNMFGQNAAQNGKITVKGDGTNSSLITKLIGTSTNGKVVAG